MLAQLIQKFYPISLLPVYESWHSGAIAYSSLFVSQVIILVLMVDALREVSSSRRKANVKMGLFLKFLGFIYFSLMLFRLLLGLTIASDHTWFSSYIPAFFHLVIALFVIVYGNYLRNGVLDEPN